MAAEAMLGVFVSGDVFWGCFLGVFEDDLS